MSESSVPPLIPPKPEDENTDLTELLNDLDNIGPESSPQPEQSLAAKYFKKPKSALKPEPKPEPKQEVTPPKSEVEHKPQVISVVSQKVEEPKNDAAAEMVTKIMSNFGEIQNSLWEKLNADRKQIDEFIKIFTDRIHDPELTKTCYVEGLTALLNIKADSSVNATKMLDSIAKMVAVIKNMKADSNTSPDLSQWLDGGADFDPEKP